MHRSLQSRDLFSEMNRLQRDLAAAIDTNIRRRGYPALNVGLRPESVEIYAFAPGLDPSSIKVDLDRGVLSLAGERATTATASPSAQSDEAQAVPRSFKHQSERFAGRFRRVVNLPDDIDPEQVSARYRDGVLQISVARKAVAPARRINVN